MRGGKRENSGAKKKDPTTLINFRLPISTKSQLKSLYPEITKEFKEWVNAMIENKL